MSDRPRSRRPQSLPGDVPHDRRAGDEVGAELEWFGQRVETWGKRILTIVALGGVTAGALTLLGWRRVDNASELAVTNSKMAALADTVRAQGVAVSEVRLDIKAMQTDLMASIYMQCQMVKLVAPNSLMPKQCSSDRITGHGGGIP